MDEYVCWVRVGGGVYGSVCVVTGMGDVHIRTRTHTHTNTHAYNTHTYTHTHTYTTHIPACAVPIVNTGFNGTTFSSQPDQTHGYRHGAG